MREKAAKTAEITKAQQPSFLAKIGRGIANMPKGKKAYAILWLITCGVLIALISSFVVLKKDYTLKSEKYSNYSRYLEVKEKQPPEVLKANFMDGDQGNKNYYIQAQIDEDLNGDGIITKPDTVNKNYAHADIVHGVFYPLGIVRKVPQIDALGNEVFDFKSFHIAGYRTPTVTVKNGTGQIDIIDSETGETKTLKDGMVINLKEIYDDVRWFGDSNVTSSLAGEFLSKFNVDNINKNEQSVIGANEPYGEYEHQGKVAYDIERQADGVTPMLKPNIVAKKAINVIAYEALVFLGLLASTVLTTVIVSIYEKKHKKGSK